eukprot:2462911-Rhodomonas_salina.3
MGELPVLYIWCQVLSSVACTCTKKLLIHWEAELVMPAVTTPRTVWSVPMSMVIHGALSLVAGYQPSNVDASDSLNPATCTDE